MPPWGLATATGVGSLPGEDPLAAARWVFEAFPDLPHLVELPDRGTGADLVGRGTALLAELAVDLQPAGWRLVARAGRDLARTRDLLARDLDALEEAGQGYTGPLKLQAAGPWTLLAAVELPRGDKVLADPGACREVVASLAQGLAGHAAEIRRRLPGVTELLVQLDEPSLPAVRAGHMRTASGFSTLRVPPDTEVEGALADIAAALTGAGAVPGVHCCAAAPPLAVLRAGGARWVSLDLTLLTPRDDDALGEALEAGVGLLAGLVPPRSGSGLPGALPLPPALLAPLRAAWSRLGQDPARLAEVGITPTCGLAGSPDPTAVARRARECAQELAQ